MDFLHFLFQAAWINQNFWVLLKSRYLLLAQLYRQRSDRYKKVFHLPSISCTARPAGYKGGDQLRELGKDKKNENTSEMCCAATVFMFLFQKLSGSHKALVEMQDDVSELLRSATREYKQTKVKACSHSPPHYRYTSPGHRGPSPSCTIVSFVMTEYPTEWEQATGPQRSGAHLST